jgi:hypothetical protein
MPGRLEVLTYRYYMPPLRNQNPSPRDTGGILVLVYFQLVHFLSGMIDASFFILSWIYLVCLKATQNKSSKVRRQPTHKSNTKNILTKKKGCKANDNNNETLIIDLLLKRKHGDEAKNQQKRRSRPMRRDSYSTISAGAFPFSKNSLMTMETSGNSGIPRVVCFPTTNEATAAPRELPLI